MALTAAQWTNWRKSVDHTVAMMGQALWLLDGNYEPVCELPPVLELSAGNKRLEASELTVTMPALMADGTPHMVVEHLVDKGFGELDAASRLAVSMDKSWFIMVQRAGGEAGRRIYKVTFPNLAIEGYELSTLRVEAIQALSMLEFWPCPSVPTIWGHEPVRQWTEDAGGPYEKPLRYAPVEMATVARGYTAYGPAESTIQGVIQDSLDAGNRAMGWVRPHMVVDRTATGRTSPTVAVQREDRTVWETVAEPARLAGCDVRVDLWVPGDAAFPVRYERGGSKITGSWSGTEPVLVVRVEQMEVT